MLVELTRIEKSEDGTFGALCIDGKAFCVTLEPPDYNHDGVGGNERDRSCIPEGVYLCKHFKSQKYGDTFLITDVPGRDSILFHAGNTLRHTKGCILLGSYFGYKKGLRGVWSSVVTFDDFMRKMIGVESFALNIRVAYQYPRQSPF